MLFRSILGAGSVSGRPRASRIFENASSHSKVVKFFCEKRIEFVSECTQM